MSKLININDLGWITSVSNSLSIIANDLQEVNDILNEVDDCINESGVGRYFTYSYVNKNNALKELKEDIKTYKESVSGTTIETYGYTPSTGGGYMYNAIADNVDACIDNAFYLSLDQVVEKISLAQLDRYTTKNVGSISIRYEDWTSGEKIINYSHPNKLDINNLLSSQLSRDMLKSRYEDFLTGLFPGLDDISGADYDYYYKKYLSMMMGVADFNHTTKIEDAYNYFRNGLLFIGLATTGLGLLGYGGAGLTILGLSTNGAIVAMDLYTYLTGKDENGNPLSQKELDALGRQVLLDSTLFALSTYLTVKELKGANSLDDIITDGSQITKVGNKKVLQPNCTYQDANGHIFQTDDLGRIINGKGDLQLGTGTRNPYAQRTVGGVDRLPGDDGGHIFGNQFLGSGDIDNLLPQGSTINRAGGEYYNLEMEWAEAIRDGAKVSVDITPVFEGTSLRPIKFDIKYSIDGESFFKSIINN